MSWKVILFTAPACLNLWRHSPKLTYAVLFLSYNSSHHCSISVSFSGSGSETTILPVIATRPPLSSLLLISIPAPFLLSPKLQIHPIIRIIRPVSPFHDNPRKRSPFQDPICHLIRRHREIGDNSQVLAVKLAVTLPAVHTSPQPTDAPPPVRCKTFPRQLLCLAHWEELGSRIYLHHARNPTLVEF